uniref:Ovule protein n=1 Tax=Heterorhabditis bacteriophora TaxID=37862 RepID=A0A1I7WBM3_HETBA
MSDYSYQDGYGPRLVSYERHDSSAGSLKLHEVKIFLVILNLGQTECKNVCLNGHYLFKEVMKS